MEKALPMNENENLLWGKWKGTGVSEHQRSRLLIQHRLEERKKKEYECNRKNDEDQQRRADMQLLPFTKEERRLWRQWTRQGITGRDRRKLLKHERRKARKLQGYLQKREITKKNEREKARKLQGHVQEREITKKNERETDIFIACLLGVPFILVVLVVFIFISKPYDIDVYHLGNRHAAGDGVWQMNTIFTIYRFFKRNRENNGTQKIYARATSDRCAPPNRWIRHAGRPVPSCRYEIVGDQDAQRVHPENRAAI